jgi:acyl-CoA thioesterase-1
MIAVAAALVVVPASRRGSARSQGAADTSCAPAEAPAAGACALPAVDRAGTGGGSVSAVPQPLTPNPRSRRIVFLGTSLTAGLGLDPSDAYPALIGHKLDSLHLPWRAVNAGVSGETSAGALRRLDWVLRDGADFLVVETGANDGLRGVDLDSTRANLEAIVRRARALAPGVRIVVAGMEVPPNLGPRYASRFRRLFPDLAARENLVLIPFLLRGVGGVDTLNQADGIHPNRAGERIVAENAWRVIRPLVEAGAPAPRAAPLGGEPGHP